MSLLRHFIPAAILVSCLAARAEVTVTVDHVNNSNAAPAYKFAHVQTPLRGDAAAKATFTIVDGEGDPNGGDIAKLNDGALPSNPDQPRSNFFFRAGTDGGRIVIDLGSVLEVRKVNTYSWHAGTRGPQVYVLFSSDGKAAEFSPAPKRGTDPTTTGWVRIASVDTRPKEGEPGGQYGVSITDSGGKLSSARYLLFDISQTEDADPFGNTFYSEIDILDREVSETAEAPPQITDSYEIEGTPYRFTIETTEAPDLTEWARRDLTPVMKEWYPKIVAMLPSEGFEAPRNFSINFTNSYRGVAATSGNRIVGSPSWYRQNLKGEAIGSLVHELVHVVQQYRRARGEGAVRPPGWLVEGIPDYIRWFLYEPQTHGADIKPANADRAKYDGSYRVSGNFLNWVVGKYDKELIKELNAAMREGRFDPEIWTRRTGKPVEELAEEWKKSLKEPTPPPA